MTDFLSLFGIFCSSSLFEVLLSTLVPVVLVAGSLTLLGVVFHGKSV